MNIKNIKKDRGFTIVELLIVIVVIGILAAITLVAFNGVQDRGKTAAGQSAANSVVKKAQAFYTINSSYPVGADTAAVRASFNTEEESNLEGISVVYTAAAPTAALATDSTVAYRPCSSGTGAVIYYWDYTEAGAGAAKDQTLGTC